MKSGAAAKDVPTRQWTHFTSMAAIMEKNPQPRVNGDEQESLAQAAVEHLGALRSLRAAQNKDEIYYFCMRLDAQLRTLPRDVAEDLINSIENAVHDTSKQCRAAMRDSDQ
ncbi:uncharacterized protein LOC144166729 [Haemaphysalis longicornis]